MAHLLPCSGCARHVRASETACPFCGAAITATAAPRVPSTRLGRAKTFAFGAVVATSSIVGCSSSTTPGTDSGTRVDAQIADSGGGGSDTGTGTDSGSPGDDAGSGTDSGTATDSGTGGTDSGTEPDAGIAPPYGAPAFDAGQVDAGETVMPLYGGPPGD